MYDHSANSPSIRFPHVCGHGFLGDLHWEDFALCDFWYPMGGIPEEVGLNFFRGTFEHGCS